jgi:hypothetical protein
LYAPPFDRLRVNGFFVLCKARKGGIWSPCP